MHTSIQSAERGTTVDARAVGSIAERRGRRPSEQGGSERALARPEPPAVEAEETRAARAEPIRTATDDGSGSRIDVLA